MKLVIDKTDGGEWRWSLVTIRGGSVKVHATGTVDVGGGPAAFAAGWAAALAKGYVKDTAPVPVKPDGGGI